MFFSLILYIFALQLFVRLFTLSLSFFLPWATARTSCCYLLILLLLLLPRDTKDHLRSGGVLSSFVILLFLFITFPFFLYFIHILLKHRKRKKELKTHSSFELVWENFNSAFPYCHDTTENGMPAALTHIPAWPELGFRFQVLRNQQGVCTWL